MSKKIYLNVEGIGNEVIEIFSKTTTSEFRTFLCNVADYKDDSNIILKLYKHDGTIIPVSTEIESNTVDEPYRLVFRKTKQLSQIESCSNSCKLLANEEDDNQLNINPRITQSSTKPIKTPCPAKTKVEKIEMIYRHNIERPTFNKEITDHLKEPTFDIWQWKENGMISLLEYMFIELKLLDYYNINFDTLDNFLHCCKLCYNKNPFHNFVHCFCVTQMMYGMIHITDLVKILTPREKLILMLSCIAHDLDHPGCNNTYQINAKTDLALIYNDQSPLENHHCAVFFYILKKPETNVLESLSKEEFNEVRKGIIQCILATDMAKHSTLVGQFKDMTGNFDFKNEEHRTMLLLMLIKSADISNEVRPTRVAEPWVDNLLEEFFMQHDKEIIEGLPESAMMDRKKVKKSTTQSSFISYVMIPIFEAMAKVLPNMDDSVIQPIRTSLAYYKNLKV
ncbi:HD-domain/PDEase-like protein [Neocallimastix lanati (nom. inval.)]|jgi:high affinity cGMP-specific 3',5'-cyclic phosphodiesterase 9|uniref:Phosphodiesterase n=1 Tax=Neocallimastix californiae TaxID=1754190 RepID=A0A1Y2A678_9FUNG|nr:HD-domain/PDEase-like protein [Neocallimastix sp. JGI-2020a]ORY17545.1 HD-domain/PDEase-like protein [Neocallimastix californiae]|eukprot:ORY17545.1 HD-domain/PDEase-like protein [Neocallimastix californiae]